MALPFVWSGLRCVPGSVNISVLRAIRVQGPFPKVCQAKCEKQPKQGGAYSFERGPAECAGAVRGIYRGVEVCILVSEGSFTRSPPRLRWVVDRFVHFAGPIFWAATHSTCLVRRSCPWFGPVAFLALTYSRCRGQTFLLSR